MGRKLIEKYRRRADFDAGYCDPIVLCNGEPWMFQRPWIEIIPRFEDGAVTGHDRMLTCGILDPLITGIGQMEAGVEQCMMIFALGALILKRTYDLTDRELSRLFILQPGNPDSDRLIREILDLATGRTLFAVGPPALIDPKASGDGSDRHSSLPAQLLGGSLSMTPPNPS
jgi:hypothetical protein